MILPESAKMDIPIRPQLAEIYGEYLSYKHNIYIIIYKYKNFNKVTKYRWKRMIIFEINAKNLFRNIILMNETIKKIKVDIIQLRNPDFSSIMFFILKRRLKSSIVIQYTFPPIIPSKFLKENFFDRFKLKLLYLYQIAFMKKAKLILPISEWMGTYLISHGIKKSKIFNFPDGINPKNLKLSANTNSLNDLKSFVNPEEDHILIYVGTLDKMRKLEILLYSVEKVVQKIKNTKLLMVGDGSGKQELQNLTLKLNLQDHIIYTGYIPYKKVNQFISISEIGLSAIPDYYFYKLSSPLKLYEYMGMGKPVIANIEIFAHKKAIKRGNCGFLVKYTSDEFAKAIINLIENPEKAKIMGENGKKWAIKNRSYEKLALEIEKKYYELIKNK